MGDHMKNRNNLLKIILPHKRINIFIIFIVIIGVTCGALYASMIGLNDHNQVIEKIKVFIDNINNNSLNHLIVFQNSFSSNLIFIILNGILGMTLIGLIAVIFLLFTKSFILGFSCSAFIMTYHYKGILLSSLYLIFGELLNIIGIIVISIYGVMFSIKLFKFLFKYNQNNQELLKFLKNYLIIIVIAIILGAISSLSETFILPALIKLIVKLYI